MRLGLCIIEATHELFQLTTQNGHHVREPADRAKPCQPRWETACFPQPAVDEPELDEGHVDETNTDRRSAHRLQVLSTFTRCVSESVSYESA